MVVTVEVVASVIGVMVVAFVLFVWRRRAASGAIGKSRSFRGPSAMQFTCARCSAQVTHTKRTVAAWEKGSRRIFCDACHKKWRSAQPLQEAAPRANASLAPRSPGSEGTSPRASGPAYAFGAGGPRGCLGVVLVVLFVPAAVMLWVFNA